jgi:hypothetical protein
MSELELALTNLGRELAYPEAPELVGPVRRRLAEGRRPIPWRRPLVIALAALLVAVAAVMAVPQARSQILDWLGIGSVEIRYVEDLPTVEKTSEDLGLGGRVELAELRQRAPFAVRVPTIEGLQNPKVYYRDRFGLASLLYGSEEKPRLLINQILGTGSLKKVVESETSLERVSADGAEGVWLEGGEHFLYFPGLGEQPPRLVGNTLILEREDGVTVRIEADISKEEALRIFRSMR